MYKVVNYVEKTGFLTTQAKVDEDFEKFLNDMEAKGWSLVTMTELNTNGKNFAFRLVFKK